MIMVRPVILVSQDYKDKRERGEAEGRPVKEGKMDRRGNKETPDNVTVTRYT